MSSNLSNQNGDNIRSAFGRRIMAAIIDIVGFILIVSIPYGIQPPSVLTQLIIPSLLGIFYFVGMEAYRGQTVGKILMGIIVVGEDRTPCSLGQALVRNFLRPVDAIFAYGVGIITISLTTNDQRLGDLAANTIVIKKP